MASYNYQLATGVIVPDTSVTLSDVQTEYKNALGQDINLQPNTTQGLLITDETTARIGVIRNNANMANQLNPNLATGVFLRSIGALMGINDDVTRRSICLDCVITGQPNSVFPASSLAVNQTGALFASISNITLDGSGSGVVTFQAVEAGAIEAAAHTLTPYSAVQGWSQIDNPTDAVVGSQAMTDYEFRTYRQDALSRQSQNCVASIASKLIQLAGVTAAVVRENDQSTNQTINGVQMPPNSLWVCVNDDGGLATDIVTTLLQCKPPGAKWTPSLNAAGTPESATVTHPLTGQAYTVTFVRSLPVAVYTRVYVRANGTVADLNTACVDAILSWSTGKENLEPGLTVGSNFSPYEVAGAINVELPGTYVRLVEVSLDGTTWQSTEIAMSLWQRPYLPRGNIDVTVE